jgi:putative ABC transport system permease protein
MAARLLRGLLFEVRPLDPAIMLATAVLVISASALVCFLPARRAMRVKPMDLLRAD